MCLHGMRDQAVLLAGYFLTLTSIIIHHRCFTGAFHSRSRRRLFARCISIESILDDTLRGAFITHSVVVLKDLHVWP